MAGRYRGNRNIFQQQTNFLSSSLFGHSKMSEGEESEAVDTCSCCASCGIAEVDDIKLKDCDDCDLVKYCGDGCRENHKAEHEEECKQQAAELRDELLFKQPKSTHMGDCPICCLPIPLDMAKSAMMPCCSKWNCEGCAYAMPKESMNRGVHRNVHSVANLRPKMRKNMTNITRKEWR